jgi:DNA-directed RNA polymerase specialized sigma subunit
MKNYNKNNWRYLPITPELMDLKINYSPEDNYISFLDGDNIGEDDDDFSIFGYFEVNNNTLTKKQKIVLYQRIVEGKTFESIGINLETSRQNIFEIYYKALERIRQNLINNI